MSGQSFKNKRATELRQFISILQKHSVVNEVWPLYNAENMCRNYAGEYWGYSIENLIFRFANKEGKLKTIPQSVKDLTLQMTVVVKGICKDSENLDPFEKYEFQLLLFGNYENEQKKVKCSWHLDRHVEKADQLSRFAHPQYHFQFGGHALKDLKEDEKDVGQVLIIDSPRIPHPPLDALLGIDFILTNFIPRSELDFREEREYIKLIESMQDRLWKPYVNSLASRWQPNSRSAPWQSHLIWPQLEF